MVNRNKWLFVLAWLGVLSLATFLRVHNLGDRPVHADEATGARILAQQLEGQDYTYDPRHFHGPTLSQITFPIASLRGEHDWAELSITTLRISTVLGGILLVFSPLLWLRTLGPQATLAAGAWLSTSPLLVYYSRVYIHETWLAFFGMLACAGIYRLILRPTAASAIATGVALGLMFATKITIAVSLLSWCVALIGLFLWLKRTGRNGQPPAVRASRSDYIRALLYLALGSAASSVFLYSNHMQNPLGFLDALRSFFVYEPTIGHEKPAYDYTVRLLWPKMLAGLWWTEIVVLFCAVGAILISWRDAMQRAACLFLAIAGLVHFSIYSAIGYKTPWLMLLPWAHFCLLAGCLWMRFPSYKRSSRIVLLLVVILGLGHQTRQSLAATGRLENHEANPYVYVPTSRNTESLADWLQSLNSMQPLRAIAVLGREYWPLPWYLKQLDAEIHYWPDTAAVDLGHYPVVLSMPSQRSAVREQLDDTHIEHPHSLRSNVPLFMFLDKDIWNSWIDNNDGE